MDRIDKINVKKAGMNFHPVNIPPPKKPVNPVNKKPVC